MVLGVYIQTTKLGSPRPRLGSGGELGYFIHNQKQKEAQNLQETIQIWGKCYGWKNVRQETWVDMWYRSINVWFLLGILLTDTPEMTGTVSDPHTRIWISMAAQHRATRAFFTLPFPLTPEILSVTRVPVTPHCTQVAHTYLEPPSPRIIPWKAWGGDVARAFSLQILHWSNRGGEGGEKSLLNETLNQETALAGAANEMVRDKWGTGNNGWWALPWARSCLCFDNITRYLIPIKIL